MSLLIAVKVFSDLCIYAAAATAAASWFTPLAGLFLPALFCAAAVGLAAALEGKGALRYLGLLSLAGLFLAPSTTDLLAALPMALYAAVLVVKGRFSLRYGPYYDFFTAALKLLGLMILLASINMDWLGMLPYAGAFLLCGVFLLRQLRLERGGTTLSKAMNLLSLLGAAALGGGLCLGVYLLSRLSFPVFGLTERIISVLFYLVEVLVVLGNYLSGWLAAVLPEGFQFGDHMESPDLDIPPYAFAPGEESGVNPVVRAIVGAVVLGTLALGVILLVRRMLTVLRRDRSVDTRSILTGRAVNPLPRRPRRVSGNRGRVRSIYRKFLQGVYRRGAAIRPSHTSAEVLHAAAPLVDAADALALRDIYISARYDDEAEITDEAVRRAKKLGDALNGKQ